jgi:FdhE protein
VPTSHPDALWRLASAQWAEITANSPELAPAVALQQRLVRLTLDAAAAIDDIEPVTAAAAAIHDKWARGLPALRNETITVPPALKGFLVPLCDALAEGGAGDSVLHIRDAIISKAIDADSLLSVSLSRNNKAIRTSALHMGLSPDLVWLIGELGSAPLAHRVSATLDAGRSTLDDRWDRGYCPVCGSWPAFIEARNDLRELRCSYCAFQWSLPSHRCVYCGNTAADFIAAAPDVSRPQRHVELCGRCSGYTKVIDVVEPAPFPLLAIADLATMTLDRGAMERGYRRPELFDLDSIEPRTSTC